MDIEQTYYNLSKTASLKPWLLAGGLGTGMGAVYGMGDPKANYYNEFMHDATRDRALAGGVGGLAGMGAYKALRGLGKGRIASGIPGLLAGGLASYLVAPTRDKGFNPRRLPWRNS